MQQLYSSSTCKSDWSVGDGTDFSRPLAPRRTRITCYRFCRQTLFGGQGISCLCSPAMRTRQTFDIGAPYWPDIKPFYEESLYHASVGILLYNIERTEKTADTVFIIGHNPGQPAFLRALSPQSLSHMPTSAAAILKKTGR